MLYIKVVAHTFLFLDFCKFEPPHLLLVQFILNLRQSRTFFRKLIYLKRTTAKFILQLFLLCLQSLYVLGE